MAVGTLNFDMQDDGNVSQDVPTAAGEPALPSTDAATSLRMARQRTRDTAPEIALRRALHRLGYRYRVDAPLPGMPRRKADILFTSRRIAVFVDGCFWHGCPEHATWPARNGDWWESKLRKNIARDLDTTERLTAEGWTVVRIWEHESLDEALATVLQHLPPRKAT